MDIKNINSKINFAGLIMMIMSIPHFTPAKDSEKDSPNIIYIMLDDLGYFNFTCYGGKSVKGNEFHTSNMDRLAEQGMHFTQVHSRAMYAPTRQVLMTGKGLYHPGVERTPAMEIPWIPQILHDAGYTTGISGKWMLGDLNPVERGFDEAFIWAGNYEYWAPKIIVFNSGGFMQEKNQPQGIDIGTTCFDVPVGGGPGKAEVLEGKFGPHLINNFAVDFINRHAEEKFFLYYPMKLIHVPYFDLPGSGKEGNGARYIEHADSLIQNVIDAVDKAGIAEKTLIVVTSDNGFSWQDQVEVQAGVEKFPGSKGSTLEGSTRVPFIVRCPGMVEAGSTYNGLVDFSDILPTFTQVAQTKLPAGETWKGRSFLPQLLGDEGNPRDWVYIHWGGHPIPTEREVGEYFEKGDIMRYVRGVRYKLYGDGRFYDMENDIREKSNILLGRGSKEAEAVRRESQSVLNLYDDHVKEAKHAEQAEVGEFDLSKLPPPIIDAYKF